MVSRQYFWQHYSVHDPFNSNYKQKLQPEESLPMVFPYILMAAVQLQQPLFPRGMWFETFHLYVAYHLFICYFRIGMHSAPTML